MKQSQTSAPAALSKQICLWTKLLRAQVFFILPKTIDSGVGGGLPHPWSHFLPPSISAPLPRSGANSSTGSQGLIYLLFLSSVTSCQEFWFCCLLMHTKTKISVGLFISVLCISELNAQLTVLFKLRHYVSSWGCILFWFGDHSIQFSELIPSSGITSGSA